VLILEGAGQDDEGNPTGKVLRKGQMIALREVAFCIAVTNTAVCIEDETELYAIMAEDLLRHTKGILKVWIHAWGHESMATSTNP
jgi:hypothetical protein